MIIPERISRKKLKIAICVCAILILLALFIANSAALKMWFRSVLALFRPILIGLAIAYLLNPVFRFLEQRLFRSVHPLRLRRAISLLFSYLFLLLLIALIFVLIFPQLIASVRLFSTHYSSYLSAGIERYNRFLESLDSFLDRLHIKQNILHSSSSEELETYLSNLIQNTSAWTERAGALLEARNLGRIIGAARSTVGVIIDALFSFFISLYLLSTKEKRYAQIMKFRRALLSDRINTAVTHVCTVMDRAFGKFLEGKMLDSLIVGLITYVVLLIFRIPYPVLIAVIIGITNVIPFVGPVIGAIPTGLIVLLTEPAKVIPFLLIVLVIQQTDGHVIGPKILGNSNGMSSFCVLIALAVMGDLWGFWGMLLGVPLFAVVIELFRSFLEHRLHAKGLPSATENYYPPDSMVDPATDVQTSTEKNLRGFEKRILRLKALREQNLPLSKRQRLSLWFYEVGKKLSLFPPRSIKSEIQFAAEEAVRKRKSENQKQRG